ncbi:Dihydroneopterin aldolase [Rickettsiales endosymbiont of Paramecium tredecaurelia]|uniref:dihydroneopterin aldolase n=1 Tax=Candidatus Sarmatiella mevalonica TaxID=2770581 RepID=UPI00192457C4|nr:dihydroneopterin aldolase [Candidatus Sarmatiella mevalonica]MBL3284663.1 Dihydroneopterin aldolase [Candidatus Sarmatiella mevalonica]
MQNKTSETKVHFYDAQLRITNVWFNVRLGHTYDERQSAQKVKIDLSFERDLVACYSDHLDDTFCYAELIAGAQESLQNKTFCLIEHLAIVLAQYIYTKTKAHFTITITKYVELLRSQTMHVSFSLSNKPK